MTFAGNTTAYTYGADGARLWRVEKQGTASEVETLYLGPVEIRNPGAGEEVLLYPLPSVRIDGGTASYLHTDQLGSVRTITNAAGVASASRTYKPFGETSFETSATPHEDHAFIGERRDTDAGLIYLNARYYDPALGLFTQPDWFEVTEPGVGTNRYAYSFNDPVNLRDPGGNATAGESAWEADDVYLEDDDERADGFPSHIRRIGLEEALARFGDLVWEDKASGFYARPYLNTRTGEVTIAYRGSEDGPDWRTNAAQGATGTSRQYELAVALAQGVVASGNVRIGNQGFSTTGHSLGGGLAMAAATSFLNKDLRSAHTFNAAGLTVTLGNVGRHIYNGLAGRNSGLTNHVIVGHWSMRLNPLSGDPLTRLNRMVPGMYVPGNTIEYQTWSINPFTNHSRDAFRGLIDGF